MIRRVRAMLLAALLFCSSAATLSAQGSPEPRARLAYTAIVTRHGVRAPTGTTEELNQYSAEGWPEWGVPPGHLTPHGRTLMELFGAYYRAYFTQQGLVRASGCEDAEHLFLWADTDQRTIETGRALAAGMFPRCSTKVGSLPQGTDDPLFSPLAFPIGHPDRALAMAAVLGRIGGDPGALLGAYQPALERMQQVLLGCTPGPNCPPKGKPVRQALLGTPVEVRPGKGDKLVELSGPLDTAPDIAGNFLLEYTNGMTGHDLGWGRLNESNLRQMMSLHAVEVDLKGRTPYLARANGSNLLSHLLRSMEQAITGKAVPGALGSPGDKVLVLVGHDTQLANFAGMLGLSWLVDGYQPNDTPPGAALVFEVWRGPKDGEHTVRTYYTSQTLEQMRKAIPLSLEKPPARAPTFVPGCSTADAGFPCGWAEFRRTAEGALDPAFVRP